ncbi:MULTISPECIES: DUF5665 domain-containing protein [Desulfitobacterium]|uniref:Uncharacterized protein n=1 Tax=Desulfitobacterium dehalogenans (strain ATCC 51507 / DSM 9161 / JW/IU-DC1) TaxID=756499 RepID=I4ACJ5_DESDJ|nr:MULTISPECIES: DUF5665 domain-containing protein [Desulfitobacterium]AFM01680.1 hypothetical protein Desde_3394 [Desulfitobacterium dehalogenans ATCC 51507]
MTASEEEMRHSKEEAERVDEALDEARARNAEPTDWEDLRDKVTELYLVLERINLTDYIAYLNNPRRLLWLNFGVGLVKGLGGAIGATLLLGLLVMFLKRLVLLNIPVIGGVIGEIVKIVNAHNGS